MIDPVKFFGDAQGFESASNVKMEATDKRVVRAAFTAASKTLSLPDATLMTIGGPTFYIVNCSAYAFELQDKDSNTLIASVATSKAIIVCLVDNSTSAGVWFLQEMDMTTSCAFAAAMPFVFGGIHRASLVEDPPGSGDVEHPEYLDQTDMYDISTGGWTAKMPAYNVVGGATVAGECCGIGTIGLHVGGTNRDHWVSPRPTARPQPFSGSLEGLNFVTKYIHDYWSSGVEFGQNWDMPENTGYNGRMEYRMAPCGEEAVAFCGEDSHYPFSARTDVLSFNVFTNVWRQRNNAPQTMFKTVCAYRPDGKVTLTGFIPNDDTGNAATGFNYEFDPVTDSYSSKTAMGGLERVDVSGAEAYGDIEVAYGCPRRMWLGWGPPHGEDHGEEYEELNRDDPALPWFWEEDREWNEFSVSGNSWSIIVADIDTDPIPVKQDGTTSLPVKGTMWDATTGEFAISFSGRGILPVAMVAEFTGRWCIDGWGVSDKAHKVKILRPNTSDIVTDDDARARWNAASAMISP